jgi:predicted nucleic acid-binding protein
MQLVVCDTTILLPALVSESGLYRKLLVVFAWGKLHNELRALEDERAEAERIVAATPGAELGGPWNHGRIEQIRDRISRMEEHLPVMTPKDFGLVISPPIVEELEHNMAANREPLGNQTPEAISQFLWSATETAAVTITQGFDGEIPPYTDGRDTKDDPIIHTAVLARAEWIHSQDKRHIALTHKHPTEYIDPATGRLHRAVRTSYFLRNVICSGYHFDEDHLREIEGTLLNIAVGLS